jgi:hypothetical protein
MAAPKRIFLPRTKCITKYSPQICIWEPRCWLCTKVANRASARRFRQKVIQRRTNLRSKNAELKRLREKTVDEFSKLTVSNNELKKKIIDHYNRCPPCGARYAEEAVSSYRRYKKKKIQASN